LAARGWGKAWALDSRSSLRAILELKKSDHEKRSTLCRQGSGKTYSCFRGKGKKESDPAKKDWEGRDFDIPEGPVGLYKIGKRGRGLDAQVVRRGKRNDHLLKGRKSRAENPRGGGKDGKRGEKRVRCLFGEGSCILEKRAHAENKGCVFNVIRHHLTSREKKKRGGGEEKRYLTPGGGGLGGS